MTDLSGKTAIVIGAAGEQNMGQAIARTLAAAGAKVIVSGRKPEPLEALAAEIGGEASACDLTRRADVDALFDGAHNRHGQVDIAVNATGWGLMKPWADMTDDDLQSMVALQFIGIHHMLNACLRTMTGGGSVIQISSATTTCPIYDHAAYIGTKAGSEALIRCFANQYGPQGIRANIVSPGLTATPMAAGALAAPGLEAAFAKEYPLGRIGTVDDIAHTVLWLCDDRTFLTGQNIQTNGGLTLRRNPRPEEIAAAVGAAMAAQAQ
ncbi:SDR family NAD(P)-dependent oxidoreductase [Blastomonas sp.]|uniref:SDR family NAD(P)-dependent oxidoreductase n=1 Tax=Blastomonas sp. TaxID=1909299 RepID=UPI003593FA40